MVFTLKKCNFVAISSKQDAAKSIKKKSINYNKNPTNNTELRILPKITNMKQLIISICLIMAAIGCNAQNAAAIEEKMNEYGRIFNTKQNVYYFIDEEGKVSDVVMSSTIDEELRAEITEFFKTLPTFSGGAGKGMVSIIPAVNTQKTQGTVKDAVSGEKTINDSLSNRVLATKEVVKKAKEVKIDDGPKVYENDEMTKKPYVIGGKAKWGKFLQENKTYPAMAKEYGAQGRVLVSFVIERDGTTSHVVPVKSCDPYLEQEAVRLIQNMPKWMPGVRNGVVSRVHYTMPITFRL